MVKTCMALAAVSWVAMVALMAVAFVAGYPEPPWWVGAPLVAMVMSLGAAVLAAASGK